MRISRRRTETALGLLSFATVTSAVALSDFVPKTLNLPAKCNAVYYQTIPGCTVADFANSVCSNACLAGLVQINALISNNCQTADVEETSIIGLFKLGKGIQILCNVAVVTTTTGLGGGATSIPTVPLSASPTSIRSSTMVLSSTKPITTGLVTDSSSPAKTSTIPSTKQSTTLSTTQSPPPLVSTTSPPNTSKATSTLATPASKTSISPAEAQSIKSGNIGSGGGSPFDNINNSGAASLQSISAFACGIVASILLGGYLALT